MQPRQIGIAVAAALAAFVVAFGVSKASGSDTKKPSAPAAKLASPKTVDVAAAAVTASAGAPEGLPALKSDPKKKAKKPSSSSSSSSSSSTASSQATQTQTTQTQTQTTQTQTQNSTPVTPKPKPKPSGNTNNGGSVSGGGEG
jgi:hypothetical protein